MKYRLIKAIILMNEFLEYKMMIQKKEEQLISLKIEVTDKGVFKKKMDQNLKIEFLISYNSQIILNFIT